MALYGQKSGIYKSFKEKAADKLASVVDSAKELYNDAQIKKEIRDKKELSDLKKELTTLRLKKNIAKTKQELNRYSSNDFLFGGSSAFGFSDVSRKRTSRKRKSRKKSKSRSMNYPSWF